MNTKLYNPTPVIPWEKGTVEGRYEWYLPNVHCPNHTLRAGPGLAYPSVDLSSLKDLSAYKSPRPVPFETYSRLVNEIRPFVPAHLPILPSIGLGPVSGKIVGTIGSYANVFLYGSMLFDESAADKLRTSALHSLELIPAKIRPQRNVPRKLFEVQINGFVSLATKSYPEGGLSICPLCGWSNITELTMDRVAVKRSSIPAEGDVFELKEFWLGPFVSDRFREIVVQSGIKDIKFEEVEIVEDE